MALTSRSMTQIPHTVECRMLHWREIQSTEDANVAEASEDGIWRLGETPLGEPADETEDETEDN